VYVVRSTGTKLNGVTSRIH